ncbi:methyl-accepting chemotaxis sensory transducer with TarH sensor [Paraburkholderia eburnea]|uniref:Methyl-accepting chemotaxis sensory transducer with TarH sensor n=1 Tax=Paraburkholderia eburnea TaxID=1189126 RepID=A0A2S4M6V0_9BURK|nr:methyl-accepting chemotaxis protein [Paraburkholderia eburnea]POR50257.1 methyl-accepting chemotaxis sensory transducer with TarH sensor [Paraburkholderia eburnea]PRZ20462.1 methyl-accepting chemotaxis sensory transducer with TarH sensor [Paraburkholderia eburnea]
MRNLTIRNGLLAVLCTFAAMLVVGAAVGVLMIGRADDAAHRVHEAARASALADALGRDAAQAQAALARAYAALKEQGDTAARDGALTEARNLIAQASHEGDALRAASKAQTHAHNAAVIETQSTLAASLQSAAEALERGDTAAYATLAGGDIARAGTQLNADIAAFHTDADATVDATLAQGAREHDWVMAMVAIGLAGALALVVVTHLALRRLVTAPLAVAVEALNQIAANDLAVPIAPGGRNEIGQLLDAMRRMQDGLTQTVRNVRTCCDAINTGAREIAAGNLDLSSRTEQQSASLEQTAASTEQLTATVRQNADHANQASALAAGAADVAQRGGRVVEEAVETMEAITRSSDKIADITGIIDGIAFQTNILALNASVEAARAGEQGRGFAVVAGEVRMLAQRSAAAAREIKSLIDASVKDVHGGRARVSEAGETMAEIVQSIEKVSGLMKEIASATVEQSAGIEQVEQAVSQMDQVTQQNAALVEQAAAAAGSLEQQASLMAEAVATFRLRPPGTVEKIRETLGGEGAALNGFVPGAAAL